MRASDYLRQHGAWPTEDVQPRLSGAARPATTRELEALADAFQAQVADWSRQYAAELAICRACDQYAQASPRWPNNGTCPEIPNDCACGQQVIRWLVAGHRCPVGKHDLCASKVGESASVQRSTDHGPQPAKPASFDREADERSDP